MTYRTLSRNFLSVAPAILLYIAFCPALRGQTLTALPDAPAPLVETAPPATTHLSKQAVEHRFWDAQNRTLFIAAAALNFADFTVTRANLQSGGQELNPVVRQFGRSTAGLSANFVGETASVIGLSYFLHKTGHHKLERAVSLVNIGTSAGAVTFDLARR